MCWFKCQTFVANRASRIRSGLPTFSWKDVQSNENLPTVRLGDYCHQIWIFIIFDGLDPVGYLQVKFLLTMKFVQMGKHLKKNLKNLVWHSHNFLLPYIIVEEYFFNSITFIFNLYFICFVVDELPFFIIIVYNFLT